MVEAVPELCAPNALVFVPAAVPSAAVWGTAGAPAVMPLCDLLSLAADGLVADRVLLVSSLPAVGRAALKGPARVFPTLPGATWEQVSLTVEEHHLAVVAGDVVERFGFAEAGFENGRKKGTPDEVWTLLRTLAQFRGVLGTGDDVTTKPGVLKQKVSTLRDRLRALLALDADPFQRTRAGQPYRARFTIRSAGPAMFTTPPGATWDDISVSEMTVGVVEVAVRAETRGVAYVRGEGEDDRGQWEGITDAHDRHIRYTLTALGLTGPDDTPTPAGEAAGCRPASRWAIDPFSRRCGPDRPRRHSYAILPARRPAVHVQRQAATLGRPVRGRVARAGV